MRNDTRAWDGNRGPLQGIRVLEVGSTVAAYGLVPRLRNHPGRLSHAARAVGRDQAEVLRRFGIDERDLAHTNTAAHGDETP